MMRTLLKKCAVCVFTCVRVTHQGLIFMRGMGAHVKKTVSSRKDLRPHTSDSAPISGALRKDSRP